jgi:AcrR family transcriptional regulator
LTQRLLDDLDRQGDRPGGADCLRLEVLEQFVTGTLGPRPREGVETHIATCLACLDKLIEIRGDLQAITEPEEGSPRLARTLEVLLGDRRSEPLATRVVARVRAALVFRIPVWTAAGVAAALLLTWTSVELLQRPSVRSPVEVRDPTDRLSPAHAQFQRTISGIVSSVRDATSNGIEAHIVDLKDASGASYILFAWGRPQIRPGDAVEINAILTPGAQTVGTPVYQGLATTLRKLR